MAEVQPTPSNQRRPWYYQNWFLIAAFILGWPVLPPLGVLWPVWGILILRSPWHNHVLLKGLGWAMLAVGGIMFARALTDNNDTAGRAVATLIPGVIVTLMTQVMWARYKVEHQPGGPASEAPSGSPKEPSPISRRTKARRRVQRRRRSR